MTPEGARAEARIIRKKHVHLCYATDGVTCLDCIALEDAIAAALSRAAQPSVDTRAEALAKIMARHEADEISTFREAFSSQSADECHADRAWLLAEVARLSRAAQVAPGPACKLDSGDSYCSIHEAYPSACSKAAQGAHDTLCEAEHIAPHGYTSCACELRAAQGAQPVGASCPDCGGPLDVQGANVYCEGCATPEPQARPVDAPLPPDVLADALQDRVHREVGVTRPAKSVRVGPQASQPE